MTIRETTHSTIARNKSVTFDSIFLQVHNLPEFCPSNNHKLNARLHNPRFWRSPHLHAYDDGRRRPSSSTSQHHRSRHHCCCDLYGAFSSCGPCDRLPPQGNLPRRNLCCRKCRCCQRNKLFRMADMRVGIPSDDCWCRTACHLRFAWEHNLLQSCHILKEALANLPNWIITASSHRFYPPVGYKSQCCSQIQVYHNFSDHLRRDYHPICHGG